MSGVYKPLQVKPEANPIINLAQAQQNGVPVLLDGKVQHNGETGKTLILPSGDALFLSDKALSS